MTLAQILHKHQLSDTTVAAALGVTKMSVGNWRRRKSIPSGENTMRLLGFLLAYEPGLKIEDIIPSEAEVFKNMADPEVR